MNTINLCNEMQKCCGCAACADICPRNAITMTQDANGFTIPKINQQQCVKCKKCLSVCQYISSIEKYDPQEVYAAVCNNNTVLLSSASGGCFFSIADSIIKHGGVVFGCAYGKKDNNIIVHHIMAQSESELYQLQGSKYVQSDTEGIFSQVRSIAKSNRPILFSGTPCQIAACKLLLDKEYQNIYYADIICHGVPSLKMFQSYITFLEKNQQKIKKKIFIL